jgi:hypothetical protein
LKIEASRREMDNQNLERILEFVASRPRYRLVVCDGNPFSDLAPLNLGYSISARIKNLQNRSELSYIAPSIVDEIIDDATSCIDGIGDVVILDNWGILFEPELGLIPVDVISKHSKSKTIVVLSNKFYDNTTSGVNLSNISHLHL